MRKLTGAVFQSLDGVMQAPGGPEEDDSGQFRFGGWSFHFWDESLEKPFGKVIDADYDLLLGKRTYDIFASYWPQQSGDPISDGLNQLPKHVVTNRTDELTWTGAQRVDGGDLVGAVTALKAQPGRELQVHGSARLVGSLQRAGLIDTYRLLIFPVVLGRGQRLFEDGTVPSALTLAESRTSATGVTLQTYDAAGEPTFGTVGA